MHQVRVKVTLKVTPSKAAVVDHLKELLDVEFFGDVG